MSDNIPQTFSRIYKPIIMGCGFAFSILPIEKKTLSESRKSRNRWYIAIELSDIFDAHNMKFIIYPMPRNYEKFRPSASIFHSRS